MSSVLTSQLLFFLLIDNSCIGISLLWLFNGLACSNISSHNIATSLLTLELDATGTQHNRHKSLELCARVRTPKKVFVPAPVHM